MSIYDTIKKDILLKYKTLEIRVFEKTDDKVFYITKGPVIELSEKERNGKYKTGYEFISCFIHEIGHLLNNDCSASTPTILLPLREVLAWIRGYMYFFKLVPRKAYLRFFLNSLPYAARSVYSYIEYVLQKIF